MAGRIAHHLDVVLRLVVGDRGTQLDGSRDRRVQVVDGDVQMRIPAYQWWRDARFGMFVHFGAYRQLQGWYTRPDGSRCKADEWIKRRCAIAPRKG